MARGTRMGARVAELTADAIGAECETAYMLGHDADIREIREDEFVPSQRLSLWSIGHSNHELAHFLDLLRASDVEVVADVRSRPWSRFAPQFNREALQRSLESAGIRYLFLGAELGGRPEGDEFYDDDGHALYAVVADAPRFRAGIEALERAASAQRLAMMCSEEDPTNCHRRLLVTRVLRELGGVSVEHIRGDGRTQPEDELATADAQQSLFAEEAPWRSTQSVSHRRARATSSAG